MKNSSEILFYLLKNQTGHDLELSKTLKVPLYSIQKSLERLEAGGIIAAQVQGRTRLYQFNPRHPFLK